MFTYAPDYLLFTGCAYVLRSHDYQAIIFDMEGYDMTVYIILSVMAVACIIVGLYAMKKGMFFPSFILLITGVLAIMCVIISVVGNAIGGLT